ncbi:MAG: 2-amino-4-hydroxy-6-hydroxymethyldihydropteridine diphosphokinase [Bacteroidales bacterium]
MTHTVYLSLGSNLGNKEENLTRAVQILKERAGKVFSRSAFYYSEPWGFESDNNFVNICIGLHTMLAAGDLLLLTQQIEKEIGRMKKSNGSYADRLIDIDLLLFDNEIIQEEALTIPHPLMQDREFVLVPLNEIAPEYCHPVLQKSISELTKLLIK